MKKVLLGFLAFFLIGGTAYASGGSNTIRVQINNLVSVLVNGKPVQSGQIINDRTMLPLRAIAEALGAKVDWDNAKKQASITMPQQPVQAAQDGLTLAQLNKIGESVGLVYGYAGQTAVSQGSGFIVDDDVFVTNWHVVKDSDMLAIYFANKQVTVKVAEALFKDEDADLIGFTVEGFPSLNLNTADPKAGDKVYALGYPHSKFTITEGAYIDNWNDDRWMHSAETIPGASGGALIDRKGEVLGVTTTGNQAVRASILQNELNKP